MTAALEGPLDAGGGDDGVVGEPVVVQREDAVGEHHDLAPDDGARAEREVEEVLAVEVDAEERPLRHARRREVQEGGLARRGALLELAAASETAFLHLTSAGVAQRPLLGVNFDRKDFFDLSFGARAVVWRQVMVFANGIFALNDDGLRNDTIIPTAGIEGTF